jgi:tRNA threonylcarbamoyladenosine biosynthesis protein TsaB
LRILGLDTATRATAVALTDDGPPSRQLEARDDPPSGVRPRHAILVLQLAAEVLDRASLGWQDISLIAVGVGPGTFTGLRIGVATARALARARGIPLAGVSTLRSLALNAGSEPELEEVDAVLAVLDARRGEVFAAGWRADEVARTDRPASTPLLAAGAHSPQALAALVEGLGVRPMAIGDGALAFRELLERQGTFIPEDHSELHRVTAINHCRLARGLGGGAPDEVLPVYLRLPDAEISRRAAGTQ